ncbi:MAG: PEP_CTERM-anchored TLD domain-containing protein [Planctomycetes bacterium]|nr:PEP_CTERM-anchored TLD domain-containing protein [Planctomycetota bacterium]
MYSFDPSLNPGGPASGFLSVAGDTYTGLAVIGSGLYVSNASRLFSIDTATGARTQIYGSFFGPYAGLGNNGTNLVVYESNLGVFGEVTTSGVLLDDFQLSTGGAGVDVHGNQIFLAKRSGANAGNVEVYDYTTHALQYVIQTNLGSGTMTGLGYDSANNHLVITAGSEIFRFSTSQFPTLSAGFTHSGSMCRDPQDRRIEMQIWKRLALAGMTMVAVLMVTGREAPAALLTAVNEAQLESWLGEGDLVFTNIFTKTQGDLQDSFDFHAAVDGQGRTFTLIELLPTAGNTAAVIGGYNPQSWQSVGHFNLTPTDPERTAFIFNLSTATVQRQKLASDPNGAAGVYQTDNIGVLGPIFGAGPDLLVNATLSAGYARQQSYGPTVSGTNVYGRSGETVGEYGTIEVYTVAPATNAPVPEPASLAIWGLAALGITVAAARRRRKQSAG